MNRHSGTVLVQIDPFYYRPTEVDILMGDFSKAKRELGWQPEVRFAELVKIMVQHDWELAKQELSGGKIQ